MAGNRYQIENKIMPMALSTSQVSDDDQYLFLSKIDNAKNVSNILKAINFKEVKP